ncbi:MAG: coenzyme F430 synthase [Methanobacterium sp.]|uniref:coenzyme F430 synthase n=1 Tax=Methanobacterium sp. TaxID=2164 RepID=UPI003C77B07D
MKVLVVDMTHGGLLISSEFMKIPETEVLALDIYKTLDPLIIEELKNKGLNFLESLDEIEQYKNQTAESDLMIVAPVHCKLDHNIALTHHEAVGYLLNDRIDVPVIEVTGVKGKTSIVWMLKEIFKDSNPLVLSSLGVEVVENGEWKVLKRNISITPASIIEAWKLADGYEKGICIFETSLGGTGLADVGILTNLAEDYPIASNSRTASEAKRQIFKSKVVACEIESYTSKYSEFSGKTNTFGNSRNTKNSTNLTASQIQYGLDKTNFQIDIVDFKTSSNHILNESFEVTTFAPAPIHITNILGAVCASLTIGVSIEKIKEGLNNFKGVKGRTSINEQNGIRIIEEINPGLNVTSVKKAISMVENMENVGVIFGGKYGVTCEEIDEKSVSDVLDEIDEDIPLILIDKLGANVKNILKRNSIYSNDLDDAMENVVDNNLENVLLIYRSNFSDLKNR